jgi:hypothetical protein
MAGETVGSATAKAEVVEAQMPVLAATKTRREGLFRRLFAALMIKRSVNLIVVAALA